MDLLDVSLTIRRDVAEGLGIVQGGDPLDQQVIDAWFERHQNNDFRFHFGIDVEPAVY